MSVCPWQLYSFSNNQSTYHLHSNIMSVIMCLQSKPSPAQGTSCLISTRAASGQSPYASTKNMNYEEFILWMLHNILCAIIRQASCDWGAKGKMIWANVHRLNAVFRFRMDWFMSIWLWKLRFLTKSEKAQKKRIVNELNWHFSVK